MKATVLYLLFASSLAQDLSDGLIDQVRERLAEGAVHSWELGTRAEALLELDSPAYSVFSIPESSSPFTTPSSIPPTSLTSSTYSAVTNSTSLQTVLTLISEIVKNRTGTTALIDGDGSAGDPASLGPAVLLANWTGQTDEDYVTAAQQQLEYLLQKAPRSSTGAISHRTDEVSLWSDFIYMVPPFFAFYGLLTENTTLLDAAYQQISLYRDALREDSGDEEGIWKHVLGQSFNDTGHWSTGNGWAAAGMLRVMATLQYSSYASSYASEIGDLTSWIEEIHTAMYKLIDDTAIFYNYPDNSSTFYDCSSTALLASTVYRLSNLQNVHTYVSHAERSRKALVNSHFDDNGWLTPVVDPDSFGDEGSESPESEAFVLEMQAAWKDWVSAGSVGSGATSVRTWSVVGVAVAVGLEVLVMY